jgi:hypothetical protein
MAGKPIISTKPFQGIRIEVDTLVSFDEVLSRLRRLMGDASVPEGPSSCPSQSKEKYFFGVGCSPGFRATTQGEHQ